MPWGNWLGSHGAGATRLISHGVRIPRLGSRGAKVARDNKIRFLIIKLQLIRFNFRESLLSTGFFLFFRNRSSTSIRSSSSSSSLESVVVDRGFKNSRFFVLLSCSESGSDQFLKTYLFRIVEVLPLPRNFFVLNSWSPVSFRETGISSARVLWVSRNEFRIVPVCYSIVRVHNRPHPWTQLFHFDRVSSFVRLSPFSARFHNFFLERNVLLRLIRDLIFSSPLNNNSTDARFCSTYAYARKKRYRVGVVDWRFVQFFDDLKKKNTLQRGNKGSDRWYFWCKSKSDLILDNKLLRSTCH